MAYGLPWWIESGSDLKLKKKKSFEKIHSKLVDRCSCNNRQE